MRICGINEGVEHLIGNQSSIAQPTKLRLEHVANYGDVPFAVVREAEIINTDTGSKLTAGWVFHLGITITSLLLGAVSIL